MTIQDNCYVTATGLLDGDAGAVKVTVEGAKTEAGDYTATAVLAGDKAGNYSLPEDATRAFTIKAAKSGVITAPTAKTLTYTGSAQQLVNPGKATGGTLQYSLDGETWSTAVPTATDAGSYTVYYRVLGDRNHTDVSVKSVMVTIEAKPDPTVTPTEAPTEAPTATAEPTVTPKPTKRPARPDYTLLASVKESGKTALQLTWTKVSGAQGYDIFFSICDGKGGYSLIKTIKGKAKLSYSITGLKNGQRYKGCVRAWKMVNGVKTYIGQASPSVHVIVGGYTNASTNAKKVTVKSRKVTLLTGKASRIKASVTGVKQGRKILAHVNRLRYYSSDRNVAKVTASGKIVAVGVGTCTIHVLANNGVRATVKVTVVDGPTKISFKKSSYSVKKGKTLKLAGQVALAPSGVTTTCTWSSSDPGIATVSAKGVVKGLKKGTVVITVTTANGKRAKVKVKVK